MQRVTLPQAITLDKSGPGMVRLEYIGPYAAGVTVVVPGGHTFTVSKSPVNKFIWAAEAEADWLVANADCKRVVGQETAKVSPVPFQVQPISIPKLETGEPVPTPTADKVAAMVDPAPPTVKEAIKRRGRPRKAE